MNFLRRFRNLNSRLTILLVLLFIATVVSTVYLTQSIRDSRKLIESGNNAVGATLLMQDILLNIYAAESNQRGYVITGDPAYLTYFSNYTKVIMVELKSLENPVYGVSQAEIKKLEDMLNRRTARLKMVTNIRDTKGEKAAADSIGTNIGLTQTNQIKDEIQRISQKKYEPIGPIYEKTRDALRTALLVAGTTISFALMICILISWYFQQAIQRERATENVKNEFLSLASHQLRTPATNVKQYLGILREGYLGKLKPEQNEALEIAHKNNEIEISIINDLLGVAKLDLNKIRLRKRRTNMYNLVKEVIEENKPKIRERRQVIKFVDADKKAEALIDSNYVKGVVENLLDNAIKYSHKRTHIYVGLKSRSSRVVLSIQDEGIGLKRKEINKLFKKFSRIPNIFSDASESTGLGLYWVKQIVELHGGRVSVRSKYKQGSTFIVELPRYIESNN
jgi:signal transduction histidine kinase